MSGSIHLKSTFLFLSFVTFGGAALAQEVTFSPYEFEASDGTNVESEMGKFEVPENREDPSSRLIEIGFVRFKSTNDNPGAPIIYLAGGPGGSGVGTARGRRFPLFMAMREFGDVIAFDQRGTGLSSPLPPCRSGTTYPLDEPLILDKLTMLMREVADECAARWKAKGIDLSGYSTVQNAADIEDLRMALGVEKVSLWGISYGSHLAFAAIRAMPGRIDRVVLTGIEGPEATVKLPARTDAYFGRLQDAINAEPEAAAAYPDLEGMMHDVHATLSREPVVATFKARSGEDVSMVFGKVDMQLLASFSIADPSTAARLPAMYQMAASGNVDRLAPFIYENLRKDPLSYRGMPEAMDVLSGISKRRAKRVQTQAKTSLMGDMLNFPMPHLASAFGLEPLGGDFRKPVKTNVPTLVLTSTLDGRTYPEGSRQALRYFSNLDLVTVHNGGHNVFMQDPAIGEIIQDFMRGLDVPSGVTLERPTFVR
jgi:pimeloyl-ACP methyl ester carboxylesterase